MINVLISLIIYLIIVGVRGLFPNLLTHVGG